MIAAPRRDLTAEQLWRYITGAYLTVGGDRDFRYLMPRIFELAALASQKVPDREIVLSKLAHARWLTWPVAEQKAIRVFIDAWLDETIEQDISQIDAGWFGSQTDSLLCGIAQSGLPIDDWLMRLTKPANKPLLADMRRCDPQYFSPFWEDAPGQFTALMAFLNNTPD